MHQERTSHKFPAPGCSEFRGHVFLAIHRRLDHFLVFYEDGDFRIVIPFLTAVVQV